MKRLLTLFSGLCLGLSVMAQGWKANYDGVMLQGFYWDSFQDTKWTNLTQQAKELSEYFSLVWLPQSAKARADKSMGYDDYYWFTNYNSSFGTETELLNLIQTFKANGIGTIADVVINHRATNVNWFDFPTEVYNGTTYAMSSTDVARNDDKGKALTAATAQGVQLAPNNDSGEDWDGMRDLDHNSLNVQTTVKAYLKMLKEKFGYAGFRYDMVKGYAGKFTAMYNTDVQPEFSVGEYFDGDINKVRAWIDATKTNGVPTSAAFDFPIRYKVRDAVNNGNWNALDQEGLAKETDYKRYAVTFVENHDTEDRGGNSNQDPIRKDTLAANAYILAMPGTPSIFLKHWMACKADIKNMILARKMMGITNTSAATKYGSGADYYAFTTTGNNGKMLTVVGPAKTYNSTARWVKLMGGKNWAYYVDKNEKELVWASLPSGIYEGEQKAVLTLISNNANAKMVYTTDGAEPTTNSPQAAKGQSVAIPVGETVLKVGMVVDGVVKNVVTRHYQVSNFQPYTIKVYVNADEADATWSTAQMTATNPTINFWVWGGSHKTVKGEWPGDAVTTTEEAEGKKWFVQTYDILNSNDGVNFVFNVGDKKSQTVDIENVKETSFIKISSDKDGTKYRVNVVPAGIEAVVSVPTKATDPYYYTLSGQRLMKPTQRGIYIHNGKKIMIK